MAKHKDIDRTSALLSGTSWYIDASHQNKRKTNRRDKRYTICVSSSECGCYREKQILNKYIECVMIKDFIKDGGIYGVE